jgi:RHS repeat-associated protein
MNSQGNMAVYDPMINPMRTEHCEMSTVFLPFGELFIEERTTWNTPYKFSGKELDEETGYSYFGARYYDPNISIWLSVDPLSDKYPMFSPYVYCVNNPLKYIDNNGDSVWLFSTHLPGSDPDGILSKATHTFLFVKFEDGTSEYYAYGPEGDRFLGGDRMTRQNYPQDEEVYMGRNSESLKEKQLVPIPDGMTQDEFDLKVKETADSYGNNPSIKYNVLSSTDISGNSNSSSYTVLSKAGVDAGILNTLGNRISGFKWGWGVVKPWTAQEQIEAVKKYLNTFLDTDYE